MFLILSSSYVLTFCIDVIFVLSMINWKINMLRLMPQNVLVHKMSYIREGQSSHLDIRELRVNSWILVYSNSRGSFYKQLINSILIGISWNSSRSDFDHDKPITLYFVHVTRMDQACVKLWLCSFKIWIMNSVKYSWNGSNHLFSCVLYES